MTQSGIEPRCSGPLANTLTIMPTLTLIYKWVTVVEGDLKAPFSIAITPSCKGGHYSIPWIAPLYPYKAEHQVPFF